jgi:hypothetical protein
VSKGEKEKKNLQTEDKKKRKKTGTQENVKNRGELVYTF